MAFKKKTSSQQKYDNPEALFRDRRNRTVQGLLSHQSDMVREYNDSAIDKKDIAFELPTGSGKTLVGLLIAEFRRVTKKRESYLSLSHKTTCSTSL
jgi:superfamily II DNA or RNA helicase